MPFFRPKNVFKVMEPAIHQGGQHIFDRPPMGAMVRLIPIWWLSSITHSSNRALSRPPPGLVADLPPLLGPVIVWGVGIDHHGPGSCGHYVLCPVHYAHCTLHMLHAAQPIPCTLHILYTAHSVLCTIHTLWCSKCVRTCSIYQSSTNQQYQCRKLAVISHLQYLPAGV